MKQPTNHIRIKIKWLGSIYIEFTFTDSAILSVINPMESRDFMKLYI